MKLNIFNPIVIDLVIVLPDMGRGPGGGGGEVYCTRFYCSASKRARRLKLVTTSLLNLLKYAACEIKDHKKAYNTPINLIF